MGRGCTEVGTWGSEGWGVVLSGMQERGLRSWSSEAQLCAPQLASPPKDLPFCGGGLVSVAGCRAEAEACGFTSPRDPPRTTHPLLAPMLRLLSGCLSSGASSRLVCLSHCLELHARAEAPCPGGYVMGGAGA